MLTCYVYVGYVFMCVCMYVYVCMHVFMYVCMYVLCSVILSDRIGLSDLYSRREKSQDYVRRVRNKQQVQRNSVDKVQLYNV